MTAPLDDDRLLVVLWPQVRAFLLEHRGVPWIDAAREAWEQRSEDARRRMTQVPHRRPGIADHAEPVGSSEAVSQAFTPLEVAGRLGITTRAVRKARGDGRLVGRPASRGWVFDADEVERFAAKRGA